MITIASAMSTGELGKCIPEEEVFRRLQEHIYKIWKYSEEKEERYFPICVVPMLYQDLKMQDIPFWSYFCQVIKLVKNLIPTNSYSF